MSKKGPSFGGKVTELIRPLFCFKSQTDCNPDPLELPHEVILEILSRLPAKYIFQVRCVCKSWCNLIFDSSFTKLHFTQALQRDDINLLATESYITKDMVYVFPEGDGHDGILQRALCFRTDLFCVDVASSGEAIQIKDPLCEFINNYRSELLGSCNGVVCLLRKNQVCLLNPFTTEYRIVKFEKNFEFNLDTVYGFGFDNKYGIYKLVQFVESKHSESEINVYSLVSYNPSCSTITSVPYSVTGKSRVFLNGALHWVGKQKLKRHELVISFDIGQGVVREFPRPDIVDVDDDAGDEDMDARLTLGVVGGSLALFKRYYTNVEIWVMNKYGARDTWQRLFFIKERIAHPISSPWPSFFRHRKLEPLYFTKNAQVLIKEGESVVMFDLKGKTSWNLEIHDLPEFSKSERIMTHVTSLVSLKSGTYAGTNRGERSSVNIWKIR